ncbi:MAG TPA: SDR family oxidoreductase, partial [Stellaceae bacterium]
PSLTLRPLSRAPTGSKRQARGPKTPTSSLIRQKIQHQQPPGEISGLGPVVGLTKTAAIEYADAGIRVNAICPGYVKTRMTEEVMTRRGAAILAQTPLRRMGTPEEIAELVVWLSSDRASYVTGAAYNVDGGWMAM